MSRPKKALSAEEGCLPISTYFSFLETTNSEDSLSPTGHPSDGASYLGSFLPDVPSIGSSLTMCPRPETLNKLQKRNTPRKTRHSPKNTLVLGLEGTSAVSSLTTHWDGASTANTYFQGRCYQVFIKLRPHIAEFLEAMAKIYEVFIFTVAKRNYAEKILESLGPHRKLIRHQLYQEDCLCRQGSYIKDLSMIERDLDRIVAVATCLEEFPYQPANVILIQRWLGDPQDQELLHLIPVLTKVSQSVDVRAEIKMISGR